jgi:hypothetical protein
MVLFHLVPKIKIVPLIKLILCDKHEGYGQLFWIDLYFGREKGCVWAATRF